MPAPTPQPQPTGLGFAVEAVDPTLAMIVGAARAAAAILLLIDISNPN
jgi:hypothetical protein